MDAYHRLWIEEPVRTQKVGNCILTLYPRKSYEAGYVNKGETIEFCFERQSGFHAFGCDKVEAFQTLPNSLAYIPDGMDVYSTSKTGGEYLSIHFEGERNQAELTDRNINGIIDRQAIKICNSFRNHLLCKKMVSLSELDRQVSILLETIRGNQDRTKPHLVFNQAKLSSILAHIEENLSENINVRDMSKHFAMSREHMIRSFKKALGKTPYDYIIDRRLYRARSLMNKEKSLSDIAYQCGFSSQAHMCDVFRTRLGVSPGKIGRAFIK